MVWMRESGLPNFRKLWGKVETDLKKGKYSMEIADNFNVAPFKGQKKFVFATANALGGKNYLLANAHLVLGVLCLLFSIVNLVDHKKTA